MYTLFFLGLLVHLVVANTNVQFKCDCELLEPLYRSFECRSMCIRGKCITKKDCSASEYVVGFRKDKCYFQGKYYNVSAVLSERFPDQSRLRMCSYTCRLSHVGSYFSPCNCINQFTPFTNACPFDPLYNPDYFNACFAPIYKPNDPPFLDCPNSWAKPQPINYTTTLCSKTYQCCCFGNQYIAKYDNFTLPGSKVVCSCMCPPLLQCIDYGKKYSW
ncbi:hypothetical protein RN001_014019 [Aquatica leii]|uniref:Uncharacterized protein n=1 Tax=Aquatica leii TaxID=1421715 RepID=A0AAN7P0X4_9COLE|nr:hypothetical protein RN001_014019 [Aquatica leii]